MSTSVEGGLQSRIYRNHDLILQLYFHEWLSYRPSYSIYKSILFWICTHWIFTFITFSYSISSENTISTSINKHKLYVTSLHTLVEILNIFSIAEVILIPFQRLKYSLSNNANHWPDLYPCILVYCIFCLYILYK